MFYDKKIKYLDYYEKGERIRGCGFVKIEARNEELRIELTVSGLHPTDSFVREVMLCSERQEKQLTQIELFQGRGEVKRIYYNQSDIGGTGIPYWELCGICIHLGGEREISCRWQKSENKSAEMVLKKEAERSLHAAATPMAVPMAASMTVSDSGTELGSKTEPGSRPEPGSRIEPGSRTDPARGNFSVKLIQMERERMQEDERAAGKAREKERAAGEAGEKERAAGEETGREQAAGQVPTGRESTREEAPRREPESQAPTRREAAGKEPAREERRHPRMLDDKWLQLCAIYPHVQPFRDERDYLSIKPADFLLFPANAYRQVNNSFLLHGYYNYKHLLLSRVEQKGEILYYIGVPGNYYEKEKQVALMFGFESFECAEEPAEDGDFGYYMMRMEL